MVDILAISNLPSEPVLEAATLRTFQFIRAVSSNAAIRAAFARRGYNDEIHQAAWSAVLEASGFQRGTNAVPERPEAAAALAQVDAWDEPTFRLAKAVLAPMPAQQAFVFDGLSPQTGAASVASVRTFLDRLDEMEHGKDRKATRKEDAAAIQKLADRGIDAAERKRMRDLLGVAVGFSEPVAVAESPADAKRKESQRKAKIAVWYYFNEWSEVAKLDITRRDYLIQLGLAKRKKRSANGAAGDKVSPDAAPQGDK